MFSHYRFVHTASKRFVKVAILAGISIRKFIESIHYMLKEPCLWANASIPPNLSYREEAVHSAARNDKFDSNISLFRRDRKKPQDMDVS